MSTCILVTYATRYGSTQEVADAVAAELRTLGLAVETKPMHSVKSLARYHRVVMGAPIYMGRLHKDARRFLAQHREALQTRTVALFVLGPTSSAEEDWREVRTQFEKILAEVAWLKPVAAELFGGKIDPAAFRFPDSLLTLFPASPLRDAAAEDVRDWAVISRWARNLAKTLHPVFA